MPYATRKMFKYMKEKGLSSVSESNAGPPSKKIRELPSSVDPMDDDNVSATRASSSATAASSKNKISSSVTANKSAIKSAKSKCSTGDNRGGGSNIAEKPNQRKSSKVASVGPAEHRRRRPPSSLPANQRVVVVNASTMALGLKPMEVPMDNHQDMGFDEKRAQFIRTLLRSNVQKLHEIAPCDSVRDSSGAAAFAAYTIDTKTPFPYKAHSAKALHQATHRDFPKDCVVVCKEYDAAKYAPKNSLFLKVLRHLGKKHPNVMQTWDAICQGDTVYVFQEFAAFGNLLNFCATSKGGRGAPIAELAAQTIAKQIRIGLDFLGDMGIAHRSISPRHVLVAHYTEIRIKLTGFRHSIVYYNEESDDINYQPCISLQKHMEDYQAPEVYGNPAKEIFDPISADVWSFGATIYFLVCKKYPYDISKTNPKIQDEIQKNVINLKLSKNGISAIGNMLTIESTKRFSVDKLKAHPWFFEK